MNQTDFTDEEKKILKRAMWLIVKDIQRSLRKARFPEFNENQLRIAVGLEEKLGLT